MSGRRTSWARWLVELALDVVNGFAAARRQRALIEWARECDHLYRSNRPEVVRVGEITVEDDGFTIDEHWAFAWQRTPPHIWHPGPGYPMYRHDLDGTPRILGYSLEELKELHARRVEFNVDA